MRRLCAFYAEWFHCLTLSCFQYIFFCVCAFATDDPFIYLFFCYAPSPLYYRIFFFILCCFLKQNKSKFDDHHHLLQSIYIHIHQQMEYGISGIKWASHRNTHSESHLSHIRVSLFYIICILIFCSLVLHIHICCDIEKSFCRS